MANNQPKNLDFIKGVLIKNPTNLNAAVPYGGTVLGLARSYKFYHGEAAEDIKGAEFGGVTVNRIYRQNNPILSCVIRQLDTDMLTTIFPSATTGSSGADIQSGWITNNKTPGSSIANFKLLFAPVDEDDYFIYFPAATGLPAEGLGMELNLPTELGQEVHFKGLLDSNGISYLFAKKDDITL